MGSNMPFYNSALLFRYLRTSCYFCLVSYPVLPLCNSVSLLRCSAVLLRRSVVQMCCSVAVQSRAVVRILGTKANFKMAAGLLFAFHGTSGNQPKNNVNIFLIVKLFDWTFGLLPQNHISLIGFHPWGTCWFSGNYNFSSERWCEWIC